MMKELIRELRVQIGNSSEKTMPRVTRVTREGRLLYDPASVIGSSAAQKHLRDIEAPPTTPAQTQTKE